MKKWFLVLAMVLLVAGCGEKNSEGEGANTTPIADSKDTASEAGKNTDKPAEPKGYVFESNGVKVGVDMEAAAIVAALGEPNSYFEAPSCAFDGLDKTYNYGSFEISTYEQDGKDYITSVVFCDDLIETPEGVSLYETKADMVKAYGEGYVEEYGMLVYAKDGMKLMFLLKEDEITSIQYASTVLEGQ